MDIKYNNIHDEIHELEELCKRIENMEINESRFNPPATEQEILDWENTNEITIPESYKEWLRFSNGSQILGFEATFLGVGNIVTNYALIPAEMTIIGHLGGAGKILCFSKKTGKILSIFDGYQKEFESFKDVILELIRNGKDILGEDELSSGVTAKLMAMLEAQRKVGKN